VRWSATWTIWKHSFARHASDDVGVTQHSHEHMKRSIGGPSPYNGIHVGIIMDGNGRWASARGLPRTAGHRVGVRTARKIVEAATRASVGTLTLYAFSADNWSRPTPEVGALMRLLRRSLLIESKRCVENGVRLTIVGRRDRLPASLVVAIQEAEALTSHGRNLHLRVAIDYSARESIMQAATHAGGESLTRERFARLLAQVNHDPFPIPDVDLLIRSGGEQRLSDFLLWECAYAEFHFARCMWPEFTEQAFLAALDDFEVRERRFGGVPAQAAS
jgi:undecaprenyl diphosphate synthase